jgi:hypothetical protein
MQIGFSIGSCWKVSGTPVAADNYITWWRNYQKEIGYFNALELVMTPEQEEHFQLSKENYKWLCGMKYLSYHLTQCHTDTMKVIKQLPFINKFICHIDKKRILTEDFIKKYWKSLLFENIEGHEYPFLNSDAVCFDIAHALSLPGRAFEYFKKYERQIEQIHFSGYDPVKKHIPMHYKDCFRFNLNLKKYPIILEATFESIEEMKKELLFAKEIIYYA